MDYTIRPVALQDAEKLIELKIQLAKETKYMMREPDEVSLSKEDEVNSLKAMLDDPNILFKVAVVGEELVGLVVSRRESLARKRHVCSCGIGVVERCWGKGIGKHLMLDLETWARNKGVKRIELDVVSANERGRLLYENLGFTHEGTKKMDHHIGNGIYHDTYVMGKLL